VQSQLVPRGTESPSATIDAVELADVLVGDFDAEDDEPQAAVTQANTIRTASSAAGLPRPIVLFICTHSAGSAA
jgi:hypothetical protein